MKQNSGRSGLSSYATRICEGIPSEFPISPSENPWKRMKDGESVVTTFETHDREKLKDFVASIQELEDRMQHFVKVTIENSKVIIEEEVSSITNLPGTSKSFFKAIDEIKNEINGR